MTLNYGRESFDSKKNYLSKYKKAVIQKHLGRSTLQDI